MNTEEITGLIISRSRLYIFVRTSSSWFLLNITCSHRHKMLFTALCCLVQVQPVINWMSLFFIVFPLIVVVCRLALQSRAKSFPFDCVLSFRLRPFLQTTSFPSRWWPGSQDKDAWHKWVLGTRTQNMRSLLWCLYDPFFVGLFCSLSGDSVSVILSFQILLRPCSSIGRLSSNYSTTFLERCWCRVSWDGLLQP